MSDMVELMKTIKRTAVDAVNATKPVQVCFGKVTSTAPLKILVEQKMTLGEAQLVLCQNVTDYNTYLTGEDVQNLRRSGTQPEMGASLDGSSVINNTSKIQVTVHNGLVVGDEVILLRQQGGQKYIVVDRIG